MHASLRDYEEYRGKIQELTNNFARKGQRQVGRDPQDGQSTWDEVQLLQLVHAMMACIPTMGHGGPAVMRDISIIMWLTKTLGRGDEGRLNYLQDMLLPQLVRSIGPCACWVLGAVVAGGKTTKANQSRKVGCIRAANPLLCAIPLSPLARGTLHPSTSTLSQPIGRRAVEHLPIVAWKHGELLLLDF